jgi:hypothetical protein
VLNLRIEPKTENIARSLRVIGQSLAALFPEYLEIELNGADYVARGKGRAEAIRAVAPCETGLLGTIWNKLARHKPESEPVQPPSSMVAFEHAYTVADINRLGQIGAANRRSTGGLPDIYSLAERLRTIDRIIDSRGGQFINRSLEGNRPLNVS